MHRAMDSKRAAATAVILAVVSLTAGCAFNHTVAEPAWFKARKAALKKDDYPKLASVPQPTPSSRSMASWSQVETDVEGAGKDVEANPRSAPATQAPEHVNEFEAKARKAAEQPRPER